jgi:hypothetical protein
MREPVADVFDKVNVGAEGHRGLREVPPRPARSSPRRRRGIYAAAGGLAAVVIAAAIASNLGGKGGPEPALAEGARYRPPSATGTYQLPAGAISRVEGIPVSALIANAQAQLGRGQITPPRETAAPRAEAQLRRPP